MEIIERAEMSKTSKTAIICAYRAGEDDLPATTESARMSIGKGANFYAVEDTERHGPARTRHRGIEAAESCDVIIIIDAHMRFQGDVLKRLAAHVRKHGGLAVPLCHHNDQCSFDANTPTGKHFYAGARIVYRSKNGAQHLPLEAKWSRDAKPGPRGAVMGACYAFRRDWYMDVGQPLSALPGWGCDEEALSIAAWMSGHTPIAFDGHVAHRYRTSVPWKLSDEEAQNVKRSRYALIHGVVSEITARRELEQWAGPLSFTVTPEAERFRLAMLKQPRKWREWRAQVCEPDEIDGKQEGGAPVVAVDRAVVRHAPRQLPVVSRTGIQCTHCKAVHDPSELKSAKPYPNGNRRHQCPNCQNYFISNFHAKSMHHELV